MDYQFPPKPPYGNAFGSAGAVPYELQHTIHTGGRLSWPHERDRKTKRRPQAVAA